MEPPKQTRRNKTRIYVNTKRHNLRVSFPKKPCNREIVGLMMDDFQMANIFLSLSSISMRCNELAILRRTCAVRRIQVHLSMLEHSTRKFSYSQNLGLVFQNLFRFRSLYLRFPAKKGGEGVSIFLPF